MKGRFTVTLIAAAMLLIAAVAGAQTTGNIVGRVTDDAGTALPGVTISISSPQMIGTKSTTSDNDGSYRFSLVPPGTYAVKATLSGFGDAGKSKINIGLDQTITVNLTMRLATATEITVTGEAPVVDTTNTTTGANFTSDFVETLPVGRSFASVATKTPGVITGAGLDTSPNFFGSTGAENSYVIDGVNTTEIQYGRQGKELTQEFVQEIEVKTGGYQAEYGRSTGGVLNVITKSGGNEFHGDLFGYYQGDSGAWLAKDKRAWEKAQTLATTRNQTDFVRDTERMDYGLGLGGYIMKDRLWFFATYNVEEIDLNQFTTDQSQDDGLYRDANGNKKTTLQERDRDFYSAKLTGRITDNISVVASLFADPQDRGPTLRAPASTSAGVVDEPATYLGTREFGGDDFSLRAEGVLSDIFLFRVQGARHQEQDNLVPDFPEIKFETKVTTVKGGGDPSRASREGGFGRMDLNEFKRDYYRADASLFLDALGSHELKAGIDFENVSAEITREFTGPGNDNEFVWVREWDPNGDGNWSDKVTTYQHEYYSDGSKDANGAYVLLPNVQPNPETDNRGYYLQDTWRISNFTVNLGVRLDQQTIKNQFGEKAFSIDDEWQPRIGFVWDVKGDGRGKVYASGGRFYQSIPMDINIRAYGGEITTSIYNFDINSHLGDPAACQRMFELNGTNVCRKFSDGSWNPQNLKGGAGGTPVSDDLKGQYIEEYILGYDQQIGEGLAVGAKYMYRALGRVVEDGGATDAEGNLYYFIFNPGSTFSACYDPEDPATCSDNFGAEFVDYPPKRFYRGIQLTATKRFATGLQFLASYTYSKLEGNYDGVFQTSTGQLDPNINSAYDYNRFMVNARGYLSNDRRHQFKLDGSWSDLLPGLDVGLSTWYYSGMSGNYYGYDDDYRNYELYLLPRGSGDRMPAEYDADLHLGYRLPIGPVSVSMLVDVFNIFNRQSVITYDQRYHAVVENPQTSDDVFPDYPKDEETGGVFGAIFSGRRALRAGLRLSF